MNLHAIVTPAISAINPPILGTVKVSTGATTDAAGKRTPTYTTTANMPLQVQALTAREIEHVDSLNIENVTRSVYFNGFINGLDRAAGQGGDILIFNGITWLVTVVFETWDADGWCKIGITKQVG
jgi:hypothetical protein